MNKSKAIICLSFLITIIKMNAVGGGVFLYRYNSHKEVEFLFVIDPHQKHSVRKGFEYPGGAIGDKPIDGFDHRDKNNSPTNKMHNPYNFLFGSIRELLEELVFVPATLFQDATNLVSQHQPYNVTTKMINIDYEQQIIPQIAQYIQNNNGLFFIYKQNVLNCPQPVLISHKVAIFFWDVTNIINSANPHVHSAADIPKYIIKTRNQLKAQGFKCSGRNSIDAEPSAFAWVKGNDLLPYLINIDTPAWITPTHYTQDNNINLSHAYDGNKILISPACISMMCNRENDSKNPQPNIVCQKTAKGTFVLFDQDGNFIQETTSQPPTISSSMSAIIKTLQNPKNYMFFSKQQQLPKTTPLTSAEKTTMLTKALELASILKPSN